MHLVSYCFIKWCGDLMAKHWCEAKDIKTQSPLPTYIVWSMYTHIYTLYMCVNVQYLGGLWKVGRKPWCVNRLMGGWVGKYLLFIYELIFYN